MKTKGILLILLTLITLTMCEKEPENIHEWIKGTWVSEQNDTIWVNNYLIINDSFPYDYTLRDDSLIISPTISSDFTRHASYYYEANFSKNQLTIFGILQSYKITFHKQNTN